MIQFSQKDGFECVSSLFLRSDKFTIYNMEDRLQYIK